MIGDDADEIDLRHAPLLETPAQRLERLLGKPVHETTLLPAAVWGRVADGCVFTPDAKRLLEHIGVVGIDESTGEIRPLARDRLDASQPDTPT